MKNFSFTTIISIFIIGTWSCQKESSPNSSNLKLSITTKQKSELIQTYASMLAKGLKNDELRSTIKEEALKKFDGDFDILASSLGQKHLRSEQQTVDVYMSSVGNNQTKSSSIATNNFDSIINLIKLVLPDMQVSVPLHCDEWDTENYLPLVAFLPYDFDDQQTTSVEAYDLNGEIHSLSLEIEPEVPVIVVSRSERVNTDGSLRYSYADMGNIVIHPIEWTVSQ